MMPVPRCFTSVFCALPLCFTFSAFSPVASAIIIIIIITTTTSSVTAAPPRPRVTVATVAVPPWRWHGG
jgi:hypothetical protein